MSYILNHPRNPEKKEAYKKPEVKSFLGVKRNNFDFEFLDEIIAEE